MRRSADAVRAADERRNVLHVERRRGALGEVLPKRVVEPVEGGVCGPAGAGGVAGASSDAHLPGRGDDVVRAPRVCGGEVVAQKRTGTAGPEEEADPEADREADGDVLDANHPDPPANRLDDVEEHEEDDREARLSGRERDRTWGIGAEQDRNRQHAPQHRFVRPDADHEQRPDDDSDRGPRERADDRPAGSQGVRPQHGERAEDDPETVLETRPLGDVDGDGESDGAADAVLEPHRPHAGVLDREALRGFERGTGRRRLGDVAVVEVGRVASGRQQCVAGCLAGGVGDCADPKRRLERLRDHAGGGIGRQ